MFDRVAPSGMTVLELVEKYVATKTAVRPTTRAGYKTVTNFLAKDAFGSRKIGDITTLDAKNWLIYLQGELGKATARFTAFEECFAQLPACGGRRLIRRNPFNFELATVLVNDSIAREALSPRDERRFLDFIKGDKHYSRYYEAFYILFNTGCASRSSAVSQNLTSTSKTEASASTSSCRGQRYEVLHRAP